MNTTICKHIEFNKACICTLLAVLISMSVNVDMYGQIYNRNGQLIDDIKRLSAKNGYTANEEIIQLSSLLHHPYSKQHYQNLNL